PRVGARASSLARRDLLWCERDRRVLRAGGAGGTPEGTAEVAPAEPTPAQASDTPESTGEAPVEVAHEVRGEIPPEPADQAARERADAEGRKRAARLDEIRG